MLVPLPAFVLDLLLATSFAASVLVLLSALQILRPAQFSVFPSLLLLLTLFRLSLNLASSRRILLHGNEGVGAAGRVIEAFGQFVVGGNYIVGFVLFIALIAIQYIVVSHGAVRTAEVTARFTLDALPGKQMAIDADLNAGLIDEHQARARREQIAREAEFYGAMDGAARFNQRDSIATILITGINILAGFLIGVFQLDIPFREALKTYTVLTVGDGLVTMIPSLLVSMAGGMVVTRASSNATLSADLGTQLLSRRRSLQIAAGVMVALACIPGLPKFSFLAIAGVVALLAARLPKPVKDKDGKVIEAAAAEPGALAAAGKDKKAAKSESIEDLLKLDELSLEVGYSLVNLVDAQQGGQLLARVKSLRSSLAVQLGFIVPPIHITDNVRLKPREYVISLRGVEIARWEMLEDKVLAISSELTPPPLAGTPTREPAFGVAALWISRALESQALTSGYAVVDQTSVLSTHLAEVIRQHAYELLTRQETKRLLDRLSESHPKLVEELVPKILSLGEVQKVLQQLLREQVSIRDLSTILETLLDAVRRQQTSRAAGRGRPPGAGPRPGSPLALRRWRPARAHARSQHRRGTQPRLQPAGAARDRHRIAAVLRPPHSRWLASAGWRSGGADRAHPALLHARALSSAALARTLSPQSSGAFSPGNSSHGFGAVAGDGAMKMNVR